MAKNKHTFAKRQREIKKMRKAEDKREKKRLRKLGLPIPGKEGEADEDGMQAEGAAEGSVEGTPGAVGAESVKETDGATEPVAAPQSSAGAADSSTES